MLLILVVALVGFQVMSASSYGFDGVEVKHLLPRIVLIFLLMNTSIFLIDGIINLSNVLISAVNQASGASTVWSTFIKVVEKNVWSGRGGVVNHGGVFDLLGHIVGVLCYAFDHFVHRHCFIAAGEYAVAGAGVL